MLPWPRPVTLQLTPHCHRTSEGEDRGAGLGVPDPRAGQRHRPQTEGAHPAWPGSPSEGPGSALQASVQ